MVEETPDPQAHEIADRRERVMEGLRLYGSSFNQFSRRFAQWTGLHATDAEALMEIVYAEESGNPLSPSRLAERVQLTSGATTSLVNRLESAGHVVRTREHTDRRTVTLRSGENVHDMADEFFGPLGERLDEMMSAYPPELLEQFESFLGELHRTMQHQLGLHS